MNDPLYDQFREANWRRDLTPSEEAKLRAWLASHPEMESDWEAEAALSRALGSLPNAEVPAHFTARVLSRVEAMEPARVPVRRGGSWRSAWRRFLPQTAALASILAIGLFAFEQHRAVQRAELARSLAKVIPVVAESRPDVLQDFETIRRMNPTPPPDEQLLALLK